MASKFQPQAESAAEPESIQPEAEVAVDAIAEAEEPADAAETDVSAEIESELAAEDGEPLPSHVQMRHPDGGSSDRHEADQEGNHRVPVEDIAEMVSHGFEVVGTAD